jgi:polyribonucleotide nucleotidyltransferase
MSIFNKVTKTFQWGNHTVTLETGEIARQAPAPSSSTSRHRGAGHRRRSKTAKPGQDFFP